MIANFERYRVRAAGERERIERFLEDHPALASVVLPELDGDVHDLAGLRELCRSLQQATVMEQSAAR